MVGNWLYGVAHQTALKARESVARRNARERQIPELPEPVAIPPERWDELLPLLDQELSRLPDNYRVVVVLCDLEGRTRKEASHQLGVPEGTVAGRLARARTLLARRLARRGVVLSATSLATLLVHNAASAGVPPALWSATIQALTTLAAGKSAPGVLPAQIASLTE
jgi:hypothetical protein